MADSVFNHFVHCSAAERYASARPYFHPLVANRIVAFTEAHRFERALDIACGTGQSARALTGIVDQIDAIDISSEMLSQAEPHPRIRYHLARAERMPFDDSSFDLATVGLAFHWFDQAAFLAEAWRVLKAGGWLVLYISGFRGEMAEKSAFRSWAREVYPRRFPTPPRHSAGVSAELVEPLGFSLVGQESFEHQEAMTAQQLTAYLLTQTNVIAAVESGNTPLAEAAAWILDGVSPFFADEARTMSFSATIWFLQKST